MDGVREDGMREGVREGVREEVREEEEVHQTNANSCPTFTTPAFAASLAKSNGTVRKWQTAMLPKLRRE